MTEEQKFDNRRRRKARRIYKQLPILAVDAMREYYPDYTYQQLLEDLPLRYKRKKKRPKKNRKWDWVLVRKEVPEFFGKIRSFAPNYFILHAKINGKFYVCHVYKEAYRWIQGFHTNLKLDTYGIIRLAKMSFYDFINSPHVVVIESLDNPQLISCRITTTISTSES